GADVDVGLDRLEDVAEVGWTVGVGQGCRDEGLAGHEWGLLAGDAVGPNSWGRWRHADLNWTPRWLEPKQPLDPSGALNGSLRSASVLLARLAWGGGPDPFAEVP